MSVPPLQEEQDAEPVVPASTVLPEITIKALILSVVLAAVLAGANAYLGLFAGMTVSASIPAAVVSMAVLRCFRRSNILENNIIQTAASSGEALAAGVIFTLPALLLIGYWRVFDYWQTVAVSFVGGLLGVVFTIPLRRALIVGARLTFPEGIATAEVLKVGTGRGRTAISGLRTLAMAAVAGGAVKFAESGVRLWTEAAEGAWRVGSTVLYAGINLSPALLAVGFIIGLRTAAVVFLGGAIGWLILLPLYGMVAGIPQNADGLAAARALWSTRIRYVGIGAMLVGGVWTLIQVRTPILQSVRRLAESYGWLSRVAADIGKTHSPAAVHQPRTERDASLPWIVFALVGAVVPMWLIYRAVVENFIVASGMTLVMVVAAFLFSSVAAYMAGLVGSSSNPVSGVTIATIMLASLLLVAVMGRGHPAGPAATLLIGAVVCCAAAMGGDNLQDLKTGHLVGSTPWKQQIMQVVGVATAAVVIAPVLSLLQGKYGIGDPTVEHPHPLSAPQAMLMASLAQGVFGDGLPWSLVGSGMLIGALVIWLDRRLAVRGAAFRLPVLAVALGIYLPLKLSTAIVMGGVIGELARRRGAAAGNPASQPGVLFAAGLVTGEALMGIFLALPIAVSGLWPDVSTDPFQLFIVPPMGAWPGVLALTGVGILLYGAGTTAGSRR